MTETLQFHLFTPQMRMGLDDLVARARAAESAGFDGIALMDHLAPPLALDQPMWEAMTAATWLAAHTTTLTVGHLVLCDAFRHPAVLARQAVTLDHASGGRFELGIGSGSTPEELDVFGIPGGTARERIGRLGATLEALQRLWSGRPVDLDGPGLRLVQAQQVPVPTRPVPIVIGGTGNRTMELVARFADWWNVPVHELDRLDDLRPRAGSARTSVQVAVTFVPDGADRDTVLAQAERRFGWMTRSTRLVGDGAELVGAFAALRERGVERVYTWFTDFAPPDVLRAFGAEVIAASD
jgi:alkanesulfonate monooxygenase SsuD/methylene tetrahydromethanopterin reductase-like flavin-dependent oxidoreductase (luciferase family)